MLYRIKHIYNPIVLVIIMSVSLLILSKSYILIYCSVFFEQTLKLFDIIIERLKKMVLTRKAAGFFDNLYGLQVIGFRRQ